MSALVIATERLTLRRQRVEDFEPFARALGSDRSKYMGGPISRDTAWTWFCSDEAAWAFQGHGGMTVTLTATGEVLGQVAVLQPPRFAEREIGWLAYPAAEGKGYMAEAARALRDWAFAEAGFDTLVSYIDPANDRSRLLAERIGGRADTEAARPDPEDLVYRHRPEWAL